MQLPYSRCIVNILLLPLPKLLLCFQTVLSLIPKQEAVEELNVIHAASEFTYPTIQSVTGFLDTSIPQDTLQIDLCSEGSYDQRLRASKNIFNQNLSSSLIRKFCVCCLFQLCVQTSQANWCSSNVQQANHRQQQPVLHLLCTTVTYGKFI